MRLVQLLTSPPAEPPASLLTALRDARTFTLVEGADCRDLVQQVAAHAPDQVVVVAPAAAVCEALAAWGGAPPCAVSAIGDVPSAADLVRLNDLGLAGWWPAVDLPVAAWRSGLDLDHLRWWREAAVRRELADVTSRLDDRKWVDRA